jgi:SAM-dependent methyltransferase
VDGEGPRGWGAPLYAAVLDATEVGPGTSVLDLGCGAGAFARAAVDRGARVTGIDTDPGAVGRAAAAVPEGAFALGNARNPPPGPFDVVALVQLLMHVADPAAVLSPAARAGAVVAVTVWGREQECDIRVFGDALAPWLGPHRHSSGPPPVTEPGRLRTIVEGAGLAISRLEEVVCAFEYTDEDDLLGPLFESALGRTVGRRAGPVALRSAVLEAAQPYRTLAGGYRLENLFRVLVARPEPPA